MSAFVSHRPDRRRVLCGVAGAGLMLFTGCQSRTPQARRPAHAPLVGYLAGGVEGDLDPRIEAFRQGLREAVPGAARMAVFYYAADPSNVLILHEFEKAAPSLGLTIAPVGVRTIDDLDAAFASLRAARADAVWCSAAAFFVGAAQRRIVAFFAAERLPSSYGQRAFVDAGGLMCYAANFPDLHRRTAAYVDKLLKGAKPADLPVQAPTRFDFVINLRAARAWAHHSPIGAGPGHRGHSVAARWSAYYRVRDTTSLLHEEER